jgi:diguanylate cyclase (GGDEF)-like protein
LRSFRSGNLDRALRGNKPLVILAGFLLVLLLGLSDQISGPDLSFLLFYLVPVLLVSWYAGPWFGILIGLAGTVTWFVANNLGAFSYVHPVIPYWNAVGRLGMFVVVAYIIGKMRVVLEHEQAISRTDYLTGVANRRFFTESLDLELNRTRRYGRPVSLVYMDIDDFKAINDEKGHEVGDRVLRAVARTLRENVRVTDQVARLGGDEFGVLLPETDYEAAEKLLPRLVEKLSSAATQHGWKVEFSIGVVTAEPPPPPLEEFMRAADTLMYEAKREPGSVVRHEVVMPPELLRRRA